MRKFAHNDTKNSLTENFRTFRHRAPSRLENAITKGQFPPLASLLHSAPLFGPESLPNEPEKTPSRRRITKSSHYLATPLQPSPPMFSYPSHTYSASFSSTPQRANIIPKNKNITLPASSFPYAPIILFFFIFFSFRLVPVDFRLDGWFLSVAEQRRCEFSIYI